jgi:hypothetical protein
MVQTCIRKQNTHLKWMWAFHKDIRLRYFNRILMSGYTANGRLWAGGVTEQYITLWWTTNNLNIYIFTGSSWGSLCLQYSETQSMPRKMHIQFGSISSIHRENENTEERTEREHYSNIRLDLAVPKTRSALPTFLELFTQPFYFHLPS